MPAIEATASTQPSQAQDPTAVPELKFPPVTKDHILHCGYDFWFPKYRTSCIRSRVIPLTPEFVSYIREDGIILADDEPDTKPTYKKKTNGSNEEEEEEEEEEDDWEPTNPSPFHHSPEDDHSSDSEEEDRPAKLPPNKRFPSLHNSINSAIKSLGGAVAPKLNWSSPKDATWISRHPNTMKCTSANDIYILLKSSSFISHDLDHAFDGTISSPAASTKSFTPSLVLRTFFNPLPSMEFRCFVKDRNLVAITQRDLNYYDFLKGLKTPIISRIRELFHKMRFTFPDSCWVFDVYIPEAYYANDTDSESDDGDEEAREARKNERRLARARLIDINPWSPKTDTLLFGWDELLNIQVARPVLGSSSAEGRDKKPPRNKTVRLPLRLASQGDSATATNAQNQPTQSQQQQQEEEEEDESETSRDEIENNSQSSSDDYSDDFSDDDDEEEEEHQPELRIVEHDDPAAYNFSSPQYSAHKLPKEVVDASMAGDGGMREFAQRWARIVQGMER